MRPTDKIPSQLDERDIDVLVATTMDNVFYTSGVKIFTQWDGLSSDAYCIWTPDSEDPYLVYPHINTGQVVLAEPDFAGLASVHHNFYAEGEEYCSNDEHILQINNEVSNFDSTLEGLVHILEPLVNGDTRIAIEMAGVAPSDIDTISERLGPGEVVPADMVLNELRMIKNEEEVRRLRTAAEIADSSIRAAVEQLEDGMTELEFAQTIQKNMVDRGATKIAHQHVAFGARGAHLGMVPYAEYGRAWHRELEPGDIIQIDTGCYYEGYISDIARTYSYKSASKELQTKYELVRSTNDKTISLLRDGATNEDIYEACRQFINEAGVDRDIPQFTVPGEEQMAIDLFGHSIGLRVFEIPAIVPATETYPALPIKEGMVMSVESPYKELGTGLVASEDTVVLRESGPERFTTAPETLPIVG